MQKETTEGNKIIADFMGKPYDHLICDACGKINPELDYPDSGSRITKCCPRSIGNYGKTFRPDEADIKTFKYHTSWDWLMPVVEKIEAMPEVCYSVTISHYTKIEKVWQSLNGRATDSIAFECSDSKIGNTYQAVLQFIHYHNSLNSK